MVRMYEPVTFSFFFITIYIIKTFILNNFSVSVLKTKVVFLSFKIIEFDGRHYVLVWFISFFAMTSVISVLQKQNVLMNFYRLNWFVDQTLLDRNHRVLV